VKKYIDSTDLPVASDCFNYYSTDQIVEMIQNFFLRLAGHTNSNPILSSQSYSEQYLEIKDNKKWIEQTFKVKIVNFACPKGNLKDFNEDTIDVLRQIGYNNAYTIVLSLEVERWKPSRIPRIGSSADLAY